MTYQSLAKKWLSMPERGYDKPTGTKLEDYVLKFASYLDARDENKPCLNCGFTRRNRPFTAGCTGSCVYENPREQEKPRPQLDYEKMNKLMDAIIDYCNR